MCTSQPFMPVWGFQGWLIAAPCLLPSYPHSAAPAFNKVAKTYRIERAQGHLSGSTINGEQAPFPCTHSTRAHRGPPSLVVEEAHFCKLPPPQENTEVQAALGPHPSDWNRAIDDFVEMRANHIKKRISSGSTKSFLGKIINAKRRADSENHSGGQLLDSEIEISLPRFLTAATSMPNGQIFFEGCCLLASFILRLGHWGPKGFGRNPVLKTGTSASC
ncbi:hypothetical protein BDK51DRAFT_33664 [Blyttiomyces helicus]|uniref:Uncharacterized protein n=1 Tax=Blyttiomyces helicus TaxID=388810 RepID=A0A4P9WLP0_9FUNG|nr:hypothetical protein BDK51DRAFT_33664 [Blyttiomyces helicus]|eukprot:RKO91576.1 hypothetical protein BDK51DRAFT_33664 [Blyttiomyces helicus]